MIKTRFSKIALSGALAFAALGGVSVAAHADEVAAVSVNPVDAARAQAVNTIDDLDDLPGYKTTDYIKQVNEATTVEKINAIVYDASATNDRIALNYNSDGTPNI
ncbi:MAG: GA module-containing protein [Corynebacterium sp.]|nr:GA module-containing protein [Corynebacterium sp.]